MVIFFAYHCIRDSSPYPHFQPDRLSWQDNIWGNSREKEEQSQQPWDPQGGIWHALLRGLPKWLIRERGRCQITLRQISLCSWAKSETASLSGHNCGCTQNVMPQNEMPVFNPSSYSFLIIPLY